ncbi:LLM class flavin-dependent oxidoreductase [uncultured Ruminococcus sp.]|uniref:LLM class flavin-dependent oxidoreductase n=1 Tax=uncultured Ruminococcus sp. TaxID=165186 RepID=UPI0025E7B4A7|nr:LLM class flavin-dependent oxidoreductase [uncultured Ruminococcus sp.]
MKNNLIHREIKSILAKSGMTLTEVVNQINLSRSEDNQTTIQNLSNKITRGTIKYSEILEIATVLNKSIIWCDMQKEEAKNV